MSTKQWNGTEKRSSLTLLRCYRVTPPFNIFLTVYAISWNFMPLCTMSVESRCSSYAVSCCSLISVCCPILASILWALQNPYKGNLWLRCNVRLGLTPCCHGTIFKSLKWDKLKPDLFNNAAILPGLATFAWISCSFLIVFF